MGLRKQASKPAGRKAAKKTAKKRPTTASTQQGASRSKSSSRTNAARKATLSSQATAKAPKHATTKTAKKPSKTGSKVSPVAALSEYKRKRDFTKTAEPAGATRGSTTKLRKGALRFVIQKHAATQLHFDLRLELDGVMKSWAVPKGPSADPTVKRLAMQVEDHPIEYNTFEGTIPEGEYGGGTVMLWDTGTYTPDTSAIVDLLSEGQSEEDIARAAYDRGDFKIIFFGQRMHGSYVLVRTRGFPGRRSSSKPSWLLIKHRDEYAQEAPSKDLVETHMTSVTTNRTMEEIAKEGKR